MTPTPDAAEIAEIAEQPASATPRRHGERGANLVEYTLLIALIVLACLAGVSQFGKKVPSDSFASISVSI